MLLVSRVPHNKVLYSTGDIINNLIFITESEPKITPKGQKQRVAFFACNCGEVFSARICDVKTNKIVSCGCKVSNKEALKSKINKFDFIKEVNPVGCSHRWVMAKCNYCNNIFTSRLSSLKKMKSCGCRSIKVGKEHHAYKHGLSKTKEYKKNLSQTEKRKESLKRYRKSERGKLVRRKTDHNRRVTKGKKLNTKEFDILIKESNNKCYWCEESLDLNKRLSWHLDHYVPVSKGGTNDLSNLVISCPTCNRIKSDKDPLSFAITKGKLF